MTHIRGDITKVHEVLKKGYEQPIVQQTKGYSFNTGALAISPPPHTYALPVMGSGKVGYVKRISATCDDLTALHRIYLTRADATGNVWTFFSSFFFVGYEWELGDALIQNDATWTVTIDNGAVGTTFAINIYWIEV